MPLRKYREGIDEIDSKIIELLNARCELAAKIGVWKKERRHPVYVPERESALLKRLSTINQGPLSNASLACIYREIISGAIAIEHPLTIARLTTEDDFTHPARLTFGDSATHVSFETPREAIDSLESGDSDYIVIDIVDVDGRLNETLPPLVADARVSIVAERTIPYSNRISWVLGNQTPEPSGYDKTLLLLAFSDHTTSAELAEAVEKLKSIKAQVRKEPNSDEDAVSSNVFNTPFPLLVGKSIYLELPGHFKDESFDGLLNNLKNISDSVRLISSYPLIGKI